MPAWVVAFDSTYLPSGLISAGGSLRQEDILHAAAAVGSRNPDWPVLFLLHHHLTPTPLTDVGVVKVDKTPQLVRWSACLAASGLVVALLMPWPLLAIAGFALTGLGLANLVPVFFGAAGRIPGQTPGSAIAALATIGYSGFVVGPPFIGVVADATSLRIALGLIVLACLAIAIAAGIVEPARKRTSTAGT